MARNRRLARHVSDAGWGELRRQLGYKTAWAGTRLAQANTFFPSSKTCSGCGTVKAKLPLSARVLHCEACGLRLDRDLNAACNLAALVTQVSPGVARRLETPVEGTEDPASRADPTEAGTPHQPRAGQGGDRRAARPDC
jgi:putative transposase